MRAIDQAIQDLADDFALLPEWEERISHVIELARTLEPLNEAERNEATRVRGCVSRVWLVSERRAETPEKLYFRGDSDALPISPGVFAQDWIALPASVPTRGAHELSYGLGSRQTSFFVVATDRRCVRRRRSRDAG
jgi:hypothetical protein